MFTGLDERPRVFISYSWDDEPHKQRVLDLAQRLRRDGVDAWVDRFTPFPVQGWDRWMSDEIEAARFVLCVVTSRYAERFLGHAAAGTGRGVNWEGAIISGRIYADDGRNAKFIPVVFQEEDVRYIPHPLVRFPFFRVEEEVGYEALYRLLTDQPEFVPEALGDGRQLPSLLRSAPLNQPKVFHHRGSLGNLPRLPYFFGREEHLAKIAEALDPDERTFLILIDGPGGIGKTTLAIRAAELAPEQHYPRIVFASAKASVLEPGGVKPVRDFLVSGYLDVLNSIARELGDEGLAKLDEKDRPLALSRSLQDKPALLVLDNLETLSTEDLDRLLEFLRRIPRGTKAIITSRRRTDIQALPIRLDQMKWPEAAALLDELGRHSPVLAAASGEERLALYQETGGNPLILCWTAGQLGRGSGRCRTVDGALRMLRKSPPGAEALEFVFGDLADTFTAEEMRLLAALTYFTHPAAVEHVAELADLGALKAREELESLAERALLAGDAELRYFMLTPLVADFLRRKKPEVVRERGDRLARSAYALAVENGYHQYSRFQYLEKDWPKVEAGLPQLDFEKLQTACDALTTFLDFTGRWDESIALERRAEETAAAQGDFWKAGWRACQQAYIRFRRGNADALRADAERATLHWDRIQSGSYEAGILSRRRGMELELRGDYPGALEAYRGALRLWLTLAAESDDIARVLNDIGAIEERTGEYDRAEAHYREALRIALKAGFQERVAQSTGHLADVALARAHWSEAEGLARKALALSRKMAHRELMAANFRRIAVALASQGSPGKALRYAREAVSVFALLRSRELSAAEETLQLCEDTLRKLGMAGDEHEWLDDAGDEPREGPYGGDPIPACGELYARALVLQEQGRHREAEERFREALEACREARDSATEARIRNSLGWTYQKQRRWEVAEQSYRAALALSVERGDRAEEWRSQENLSGLKEERDRAAANGASQLHAAPAGEPFEAAARAYERADVESTRGADVVLFYGSSSIEYWPSLERVFPGLPVVNRGIGGATLQDCVRLYPRLVRPRSPRVVVLYAGDNDLASGYTPLRIVGSLAEFLDLLANDVPGARVGFISIKPSPVRRGQDDIEETNRMIAELALKRDDLSFLDVYPAMLASDGSPDETLFLDDGLHLSPAGYEVWRRVVTPFVQSAWAARYPAGG